MKDFPLSKTLLFLFVPAVVISGCEGDSGGTQGNDIQSAEEVLFESWQEGDADPASLSDFVENGAQAGDDFYVTEEGVAQEDPGVVDQIEQDKGQPQDAAEDYGSKDTTPADTGNSIDAGKTDTGTTPTQDVGDPCTSDSQCKGGSEAACIPDEFSDGTPGWPNGYCTILNCDAGTCPSGSECFVVSTSDGGTVNICLATCNEKGDCNKDYACADAGACIPACVSDGECPEGDECGPEGLCVPKPCIPGGCGSGMVCDIESGQCIPDITGGPGQGPGPDCADLPQKDCTGTISYCGELIQFEPLTGTGYDNYPLNGECYPCAPGKGCNGYGTCTTGGKLESQWRSWARRDLVMLVKWAAAYVDCKAKSWGGGNGKPIGLGDMSEKDGSIPGTSIGEPGHPAGTHEDGYDMDIAYFQSIGNDNYLKAVCDHYLNGKDQYHCTKAPNILDLWRTTLFIGALLTSDRTRVIGVDGKIGPLVEQAMPVLCAKKWLPQKACNKMAQGLAYATYDDGSGWFYFHHHHLHLSLWGVSSSSSSMTAKQCITRDCSVVPEYYQPNPAWDIYGKKKIKRVKFVLPELK